MLQVDEHIFRNQTDADVYAFAKRELAAVEAAPDSPQKQHALIDFKRMRDRALTQADPVNLGARND